MWNNIVEIKIKPTFLTIIGKSKYHVKYIKRFMKVHQNTPAYKLKKIYNLF